MTRHNVNDVVRALQKLPMPTRAGEQYDLPVNPIPRCVPNQGHLANNEVLQVITVEAVEMREGCRSWFEWTIAL